MAGTEERLQSLEERVARLEAAVREGEPAAGVRKAGIGRMAGRSGALARDGAIRRLGEFLAGEGALARIGISLLLVGLVYLVKYGLDQGWVGESARVVLAAVAGGVLLGLGFRLKRRGRMLAQILMGGGVGAFYLATYSAYEFYDLIPFWAAMALATATTALCLVLAFTEDSPSLATVAVLAGLSTPFLLRSETASVAGLSAYLLAVQAAVITFFVIKRWRLALVLSGVASIVPLYFAAFELGRSTLAFWPAAWFVVALLAAFTAYGVLPATDPERPQARLMAFALAVMTGVAPLVLLVMLLLGFDGDRWFATAEGGVLALSYGIALYLTGRSFAHRGVLLFGACATAAVALLSATDGQGMGLVMGIALVAQYMDRDDAHAPGSWIARAFMLVGLLAILIRLTEHIGDGTWAWDNTLYDGIGIAAIALTSRWSTMRGFLLGGAWVLGLAWLQREFAYVGQVTGSGAAAATAAWAVAAIVLIVAGLRLGSNRTRYAGMATIALVVVKLVVFDLDQLDPVWRILIFIGAGVALLSLSYLFPRLFQGAETEPAEG